MVVEAVFQVVAEFVLQAMGEVLAEIGLRLGISSLGEPFRKRPNPWLAALGYLLFGAIAGGISLLLIPSHLVTSDTWRIVNVVVTPVAVGFCMVGMGAWRAKRGQPMLRIDRFAYGYLFALSFALVRYLFAG